MMRSVGNPCARAASSVVRIDLWLVDRVRQEVDRNSLFHAELRRRLDGFAATGLVEAVAVEIRDLRQHRHRRLALRPSHQGFVGVDAVAGHVHDGLKCIVELEVQPGARAAIGAAIWHFALQLREVGRLRLDRDHLRSAAGSCHTGRSDHRLSRNAGGHTVRTSPVAQVLSAHAPSTRARKQPLSTQ
jgi:hypothetical protein